MLRLMEALFVVVLAAAMLGVGLVALMVLRRMRKKMDPTDFQER
jgi:NADH:ubiquinone oxidoreductase subunit K